MISRKANLGFVFGQYVFKILSASVATPQIPVRGFHCLESGFKTLLFSLMLCHRASHPDCIPSSATAVTFPDCAPSSATAVTFPVCAPSSTTAVTFPDCAKL